MGDRVSIYTRDWVSGGSGGGVDDFSTYSYIWLHSNPDWDLHIDHEYPSGYSGTGYIQVSLAEDIVTMSSYLKLIATRQSAVIRPQDLDITVQVGTDTYLGYKDCDWGGLFIRGTDNANKKDSDGYHFIGLRMNIFHGSYAYLMMDYIHHTGGNYNGITSYNSADLLSSRFGSAAQKDKPINIRVTDDGTTIRAKAWSSISAEPGTWDIERTLAVASDNDRIVGFWTRQKDEFGSTQQCFITQVDWGLGTGDTLDPITVQKTNTDSLIFVNREAQFGAADDMWGLGSYFDYPITEPNDASFYVTYEHDPTTDHKIAVDSIEMEIIYEFPLGNHDPTGLPNKLADPWTSSACGAGPNGARIVVVGTDGRIQTSDDLGQNWTVRTSGVVEDLWDVDFGDGKFMAVGDNGVVLISTDYGVTWTLSDAATQEPMIAVKYNRKDKMFCCGGRRREIRRRQSDRWYPGFEVDDYGVPV